MIRLVNSAEKEKCGQGKSRKRVGEQNQPTARSSGNVRKVAAAVNRANPPTQNQLASRLGISQSSINRILSQDLGLKIQKKRRVHNLTEKQIAQRLERGPRFLTYLGMFKTRMIFTMDETVITLNDLNVGRDFYYEGKKNAVPEDWMKLPRKSWPAHVMLAIGICWNGVSRAYIVPEASKVNAEFFIDFILRPMVQEDIPWLYGERAKDVVFHMDSAPAHTSKKTIQWLKSNNVKWIPKEDWMANSPDMAPLDYGVNANLKRILRGRRATTVDGLKKAIVEEWDKFDLKTIRGILSSWSNRVNLMIERKGSHVEHIL